jgi:hypothetical protein
MFSIIACCIRTGYCKVRLGFVSELDSQEGMNVIHWVIMEYGLFYEIHHQRHPVHPASPLLQGLCSKFIFMSFLGVFLCVHIVVTRRE